MSQERDCQEIEKALKSALKTLGEPSMRILVYHLEERYGIRLGRPPCSSVEEIEAALVDIAGAASGIVIARMRQALRSGAGCATATANGT